MIGKIGASGTGFPVGSDCLYTVTSSGELNLGINDIVNFSDNGGTLIATVVKQRNNSLSKVDGSTNEIPTRFGVDQNYPNPFNPSTTIQYQLSSRENVQVNVYNATGQLVRTLLSEEKDAGNHSVVWDGTSNAGNLVSSGAYFYQVKVGDFVQAKKMILLK